MKFNSIFFFVFGNMESSLSVNIKKRCENKTKKPFRIHIEGNIGSGKSNFLSYFNLLDNFYNDPKLFAFVFQSYVLLSLTERNLEPASKPIQVYERSLATTEHIFLKALEQTKYIDECMKAVLDEHLTFFKNHYKEEPDLIIYIKTTPSSLIERIQTRGRSEERSISKKYLLLLHSLHERYIKTIKRGKVITINGNLAFEDLEGEYNNCIDLIDQILYNNDLDEIRDQLHDLSITTEKETQTIK